MQGKLLHYKTLVTSTKHLQSNQPEKGRIVGLQSWFMGTVTNTQLLCTGHFAMCTEPPSPISDDMMCIISLA